MSLVRGYRACEVCGEALRQEDQDNVLNFSDRTYSDFFIDYRVEIDAAEYRTGGGSKAKRMRTFWAIAPNHSVGRVLEGLISYGIEEQCLGDSNPELIDACRKIAQRLLADQPVAELDALTANSDERDFEVVAEQVREAIEKNQPEGALDRLHTFVIKFIRIACEAHGIVVNRDKALHSIFGEYAKALRESGHLLYNPKLRCGYVNGLFPVEFKNQYFNRLQSVS